MINKLKVLGECIQKNEGDNNSFNLNNTLESANVIVLNFFLDENECYFKEIDIFEYDTGKREKVLLLKDVKGNKVSSFPTVFIDAKGIDKSLKKLNRILKVGELINPKLSSLSHLFNKDYLNWLKSINDAEANTQQASLSEKKSDSYLNKIADFISQDDSNLCTIHINGEYVGDSKYFQPIKENYFSSIDKDYYEKYSTISLGKGIHCYTCRRVAKELYGFCGTFKFYSANESAYIAGGFQKNKTWKNYPVCPTCANYLRLAKEKLNGNLNRYFYGNKYFLIPTPTLDRGEFYENLKDIEEDFRDIALSKKEEDNQQLRQEMEDEVFGILARQKNQLTFTFFFYKASNSEFKILQEAEDILPSRFQKIIDAKKKVENFDEFKNLKGLYKKGVSHNLSFNFGIIKTFFPSNFNNDFLDITTKILKGQKMSKTFITHQLSEHLAKGFRNEALYKDIEKAMIFFKFLYELNLIEQTKGKMEVRMKNKYEDYFNLHPEFYDADWKKTVFLTGALAQNVMDIQYRERGARPFRSRLNGLKLDHRAIKRLLPESIEKLEQYKSNYYRDLEEKIALLMESGEPELKRQSVDEISFYFAMGMNLNNFLKNCKSCEKPHFQCQCKCKECDNTRVYCTCKKFKTEKKQNGENNE